MAASQCIVLHDLQEQPDRRSALVQLPCRMEEAWTVASGRGDPSPVAHGDPQALQCPFRDRCVGGVGHERQVRVGFRSAEQVSDPLHGLVSRYRLCRGQVPG